MGALWFQSKPRGLDVGVLTHAFVFWIRDGFTSFRLLLSLSRFSHRSIDTFALCCDELVHLLRCWFFVEVNVVGWVEVVIRGVGYSVSSSLSAFGLGENGGGSC
jgi:hypothetical protein